MKVQVLAEEGQYDCSFIKQLYEQAQKKYAGMDLNPIEIVFGKTVINLDADLLIGQNLIFADPC